MQVSIKNIKITFILLLILSVIGASLPVYGSKESAESAKEFSTEKSTGKHSQEISKLTEFEAVVPFFAFDLLKDSYLISNLDFPIELDEEVYISDPLYTSNYFKTLFCFVISPNAP